MLDSKQVQTIREIIGSLLTEHNITYKVAPFDDQLYQECIDEGKRRGYPVDVDDELSLANYLRVSVTYAASTSTHCNRPAEAWLALYMGANLFVDDVPSRFPSEIPNIYMFNDRFTKRQKQGNAILSALADTIHQASNLFQPVIANLITTATLNFVTATLLEYETVSMKISGAAERYPVYLRTLSGFADAYLFMVFPREIPLTEYIQAVPELTLFINDANDVLSFYKEELEGENTNQISVLAACNMESKLETLKRVAGLVTDHYRKIEKILEGFPTACDAFKRYAVGFFEYHFAVERYKLAKLDL